MSFSSLFRSFPSWSPAAQGPLRIGVGGTTNPDRLQAQSRCLLPAVRPWRWRWAPSCPAKRPTTVPLRNLDPALCFAPREGTGSWRRERGPDVPRLLGATGLGRGEGGVGDAGLRNDQPSVTIWLEGPSRQELECRCGPSQRRREGVCGSGGLESPEVVEGCKPGRLSVACTPRAGAIWHRGNTTLALFLRTSAVWFLCIQWSVASDSGTSLISCLPKPDTPCLSF